MYRSLPSLVALGLLPLFAARGHAQTDVGAVIEKAIRAHGGEAKLTKYRARQNKARGILHFLGGVPFTQEVFYQVPGQIKEVLQAEAGGKKAAIVTALNGNQGWMQAEGGRVQSLDDRMLAELKETAHLRMICRCTTLRDKDYQLTPLTDDFVDSRPVAGVRVSSRGHRDVSLFFDKEYGLLVKSERLVLNVQTNQQSKEEVYYTAWQEVDGIVTPTRVKVYRDGKRFMEAEAYEIRYLDKVPDRVFAKP